MNINTTTDTAGSEVLEEKPYLINIRHKFFKDNTID